MPLWVAGATLVGGYLSSEASKDAAATSAANQRAAAQQAATTGSFAGRTGIGTTGYDLGKGLFASQLSPQLQGMQSQAFGQGTSLLGKAGGYDPTATGQGLFSQYYQPMLARQQAEQRNALENRLFQQGRLGSTGGATQQRALEEAAAMQNLQAMQAARQQALTEQQGLFNLGQGMLQTGFMPEQQLLNQMQIQGSFAPKMSLEYQNLPGLLQNAGMYSGQGIAGMLSGVLPDITPAYDWQRANEIANLQAQIAALQNAQNQTGYNQGYIPNEGRGGSGNVGFGSFDTSDLGSWGFGGNGGGDSSGGFGGWSGTMDDSGYGGWGGSSGGGFGDTLGPDGPSDNDSSGW